MRKTIVAILPFLSLFVLATGSVVFACAAARTKDGISVNAGPSQDGKLYTTWVFERIRSVVLVDANDRSRKLELARKDWRYDPATTELSVAGEIPFADFIARIEGAPALPHSFVLNGIADESGLLVIREDRLAIEGYDYAFDAKGRRLTFRNDVDLKGADWLVQYSTPYGGASIGEWKPENADRMSYLEAEHRRRWLDSWYDRQTAFWFLDESRSDEWKANTAEPPPLIHRAATPKELADMKASPVSVIKFRTGMKDSDLSREMGFDARVPRSLETESPPGEYSLAWKTIEETSRDGTLARMLDIAYEAVSEKEAGRYLITIALEKAADAAAAPEDGEWLIGEEETDLGLPVHIVRCWGTRIADIDAEPTVVGLSTWTWTDGSVRFRADGESADDARNAALLRQFIAARKGTR